MENSIEVKNLTKKYSGFMLDNVNFSIPKGSIMGLIGENGAGKSTIISAILGLIKKDGGCVNIFGKKDEEIDKSIKEQIGVVFDGSNFSGNLSPKQIGKVFESMYSNWDNKLYLGYLDKMNIPINKKIKEFSRGMKVKLSISVALSHRPKLLILDEATSGLDPVIRDEILDVFLEFVQDEENSILVSSHITSDLEKVADYITFIDKGKLIFSKSKDELIYNYGLIKCTKEQFDEIDKKDIIVYKKQDYAWQVLVEDKEKAENKYKKCIVDNVTIDDIMLMYVKGEV